MNKERVPICSDLNCEKPAILFDNKTDEPSHCRNHKVIGDYSKNPYGFRLFNGKRWECKCKFSGCGKQPHFGQLNTKTAEFCKKHMKDGMVDVRNVHCQHVGCKKQPTYGGDGDKKTGKFCVQHKLDGMVDVRHNRCQHDGCFVRPTFGKEGTNDAQFCNEHKKDGMINVVNKRCQFTGCDKQPTFGNIGTKDAQFCAKHKQEDMIDVINKRCRFVCCDKIPIFGIAGTKDAQFCNEHKLDGMVNVVDKRCQFTGCDKQPSFGKPNTKNKQFCAEHKLEGMVDIKNKYCQYDGCTKLPNFGKAGTKEAQFCDEHKKTNMVDVHHKHCKFNGCMIRPSYGLPGHPPIHCAEHKEKDEKLHPNKKCDEEKCDELALFGLKDYAVHCEKHMVDGEKDLVQRICVTCKLPNILGKNGKCVTCDPELFEHFRKFKQTRVENYFTANNVKYLLADKTFDHGACSKKRPDFIFACPNYLMAVEVDEDQHHYGYNPICEKRRMIELQLVSTYPMLFLRFNPDKYKPMAGRSVEKNDQVRMADLVKQIQYWQTHKLPDEGEHCYVTYMYYDGDDPTQWKNIKKVENDAPLDNSDESVDSESTEKPTEKPNDHKSTKKTTKKPMEKPKEQPRKMGFTFKSNGLYKAKEQQK